MENCYVTQSWLLLKHWVNFKLELVFLLKDNVGLYSPRNDPHPEMIPNPEMLPKSTQKWYRPRTDPHFSSRRPGNDPQLILGMEVVFRHGIITNLLQDPTLSKIDRTQYLQCFFLP